MVQQCSAVIIGVGPEQGLGATLSTFFSGKGLHVFIAGRSEDKLRKIVDKIRQNGGSATPVVADAMVELEVAHLFNKVRLEGFCVDIAAYNVDGENAQEINSRIMSKPKMAYCSLMLLLKPTGLFISNAPVHGRMSWI
jgi:short-subunit dehydrogenase